MRDFFRAAVFFFITPRFAALSIAWYAVESIFCASSLLPVTTSLRIFFTSSFIVALRRMLKTCFRFEARSALCAPLVIGII